MSYRVVQIRRTALQLDDVIVVPELYIYICIYRFKRDPCVSRMELASKLRELGAAWDANSVRIDVDTHTGDRRLIAMRTFDVGEEIARIESSGCLGPSTTTAAAADAAERMQRAAAKYCESSWVPTLAFVLMYERSLGQSSQWYGYVSSLPVQADVPSSFSSSQWPTAILRGTEAQALVSSDEVRYTHAA